MDIAFEGPISVAPRSIRSIPATDGTAIARGAVSVRKATARVGHVGVYELVAAEQALAPTLQARGEALQRLGRGGVSRVLRVREVRADGRSFTADWWEVGTVDDLSALGWELTKRLELATAVGRVLESMHAAGAAFGALRPDDILFDDDLEPILGPVTLAGSSDARDALYTAPETRGGAAPDARSDVFAFGQLLHFVLAGSDPAPSEELVPLLAALTDQPAGLARIVRKATCLDPAMRYASVAALLADLERYGSVDDVGLAHASAAEPNRTGLSRRPAAPRAPEPPAVVQRPGSHPGIEVRGPSLGQRLQRLRSSRKFAGSAMALVMLALVGGLASAAGVGRRIQDARLSSASNAERAELVASMHQSGRRDFAGQSLAGASLRKAHLSHADLAGCDLSGADLGEAQLAYANLTGANLQGAKLLDADLTGATLDDAAASSGATCSPKTLLPDGWICKSGVLAHKAAAHAHANNGH